MFSFSSLSRCTGKSLPALSSAVPPTRRLTVPKIPIPTPPAPVEANPKTKEDPIIKDLEGQGRYTKIEHPTRGSYTVVFPSPKEYEDLVQRNLDRFWEEL